MPLAETPTVCPLCGVAAQPDGACPDCGQDLAPLSHLQARPALRYNRALELAAQGDDERAAAHLEALLADHGATDHRPVHPGPTTRGPTDQHSAKHEAADHELLDQRPTDQHSARHEAADHGPADHGPTDHGPADHGPADHGLGGAGSGGAGSGGAGSGGDGLARDTLVDAWTVLGKLRARAGRGVDARRALAAALAVRPDHGPARAAVAGLDAREAADAQADRAARRRRLLVPAAAVLLVAGLATALVLSLAAPRTAVRPIGFLSVGTRGDVVELTGTVPGATAHAVTGAAHAAARGRQVVDALVVDDGTAAPPGLDDAAAQRLIEGVTGAGAGDRGVVLSRSRTVLTGTVPDEQTHRAVVAALGPLPSGIVLDDRLQVVGATVPNPAPGSGTPAPNPAPDTSTQASNPAPGGGAPAPGPAPGAGTDEVARLDAALAAVQQVGPVLFPVGQVTLGPRSRATVTAVAGLLVGANPVRAGTATVQVDGYAASASATERARTVSEQRAAAVRDALVAAGVDPTRIVTRGLAGASPRENPTASRRVEISVQPR